MRAVVGFVLAVIGIAASVIAGPVGVSLTAANQSVGSPSRRFAQRRARWWVWRTPWW